MRQLLCCNTFLLLGADQHKQSVAQSWCWLKIHGVLEFKLKRWLGAMMPAGLITSGDSLAILFLYDASLYVTLEPCLMCYGALVHARVARVVFACKDPKVGVFSCHHGGHDWGALNHTVVWEQGPMADEAAALLQHFFAARRRST